ncbi:MAG: M28 family peptidase [Fimbriimonas ginsengisoli]|nr:M28 family peptidase [Fimbriimonas ginsengisoli]
MNLGPRVPGTDAHRQCRDRLFDETKKYCDNVRLQEFTHTWSKTGKPITMWNVIGEQNWKDARTRAVLLAHWDTRPYADQERDPDLAKKPIPGANDGASGVAVLLELMRVMKDQHPDVGVLYLLVDGEDLGPELDEMFLGAVAFSKDLPSPKPDYGILLDMIGDKDLRIPVEPHSYELAKPLVQAFYRHAQMIGLLSTFPAEFGPVIEDDHLSLNKAGVPTMDLIDFDYEPWHTTRDTPEQCSAESLGKVGRMLQSWLTKYPAFKPPERRP